MIRDSAGEQADRAVENIARLQLGPAEPRGIALDASFDRLDDAIASGFRALRVRGSVVSGGEYCWYGVVFSEPSGSDATLLQ